MQASAAWPAGRLVISCDDTVVEIDRVGASLRALRVGDHQIVDGDVESPYLASGRGQVLAPWPNRLDHGSYSFAGMQGQAAIDEPEHGNAIHGLVRWLRFEVLDESTDSVRLASPLAEQPAYPFPLRLEIEYSAVADGLEVTVEAASEGNEPAPFGFGFHPYLSVGAPVDEIELHLPAERRLLLDDRGLPVGDEQVAGTHFDFRSPRPIGSIALDDCFTGLLRPVQDGEQGLLGAVSGRLAGHDRRVELWADGSFAWLMCFTGDTITDPARRRKSVALEPMTCPPNALRSGDGLITLGPEPWRGRYGLRAR